MDGLDGSIDEEDFWIYGMSIFCVAQMSGMPEFFPLPFPIEKWEYVWG